MSDFQEIVQGRIVDRDQGTPLAGAKVDVYDKDLVLSDYLGTATTGQDGRFSVEFNSALYKAGPFEGRPDIFLKVLNPTTGKTTKSKVFEELSGKMADDDSVEVMDLGDTPVD
jgi:hypothetical protein